MKNIPKMDCFIIMPISTPKDMVDSYGGDKDHFKHVLESLFIPAIEKSGFNPIPPKSKGSDIIQAEIIKNLSSTDLALCDMSILNPNVFFEFGIRTTLDMPVALVIDDKTKKIPFDTSIINFHKYKSSLSAWEIKKEIENLSSHLDHVMAKSTGKNSLWKYFGVAQTGSFHPEDASIEDKLNLILSEIAALKNEIRDSKSLGEVFIPSSEAPSDERTISLEELIKALKEEAGQ
jgi:hypothetical protein